MAVVMASHPFGGLGSKTAPHTIGTAIDQDQLDECQMADNCDRAEHLLRENSTVAAVLLEKRLPGKNGPETLTVLRRVVPALPGIFKTGEADWRPEVEGLVGVLKKPFKLEELEDAHDRVDSRPASLASLSACGLASRVNGSGKNAMGSQEENARAAQARSGPEALASVTASLADASGLCSDALLQSDHQ
jgi:DNA-binding NtrC family response regulator